MSSEASGRSGPRRPAFFSPAAMEAQGGTVPDPAEITEVAHETAAVLVGTGRATDDPAAHRAARRPRRRARAVHRRRAVGRPPRAQPARCAVAALRAARVGAAQPRGGQRRLRGRRSASPTSTTPWRGSPSRPARRSCASWPTRSCAGSSRATWPWRCSGRRRSAAWSPPGAPTAPHTHRRPRPRAPPPQQTRRAPSLLSTAEDLEACARLWRAGELTLSRRPHLPPRRARAHGLGNTSRATAVTVGRAPGRGSPGSQLKPLRAATRREALPARRTAFTSRSRPRCVHAAVYPAARGPRPRGARRPTPRWPARSAPARWRERRPGPDQPHTRHTPWLKDPRSSTPGRFGAGTGPLLGPLPGGAHPDIIGRAVPTG